MSAANFIITLSNQPGPVQFTPSSSAVTIFIYIYMRLRLGLACWLGLPGLVWTWQSVSVSVSVSFSAQERRPGVSHLIVTFELLSYCRDKLIVKSCNCLTMLARIISFCGREAADRRQETGDRSQDSGNRRYKHHDTHSETDGRTRPSRHNPCACSSV